LPVQTLCIPSMPQARHLDYTFFDQQAMPARHAGGYA
jgi:hypothetical protein